MTYLTYKSLYEKMDENKTRNYV